MAEMLIDVADRYIQAAARMPVRKTPLRSFDAQS